LPPLDPWVATARVEAVFLILRREGQPIASDWFIDQLKSHVAIQDPIEVLANSYYSTLFHMPEGGVRIALLMTVRDFEEVFAYAKTKGTTDLKIVCLTAGNVRHPRMRDQDLWVGPFAWTKLPHSHLYG
jgi:hypothetical protein